MKKLLLVLLATSSATVFADTFQDFNNNLYAQYGLMTYLPSSNQTNGFGIGGTIQTKNNIYIATGISQYNSLDGNMLANAYNLKAGYAFQFFGNNDSGFQVIPYASFAYAANPAVQDNYAWGVGVQPEYRLLSSLKVALGLGLSGANGGTDGTTTFAFNVNPELQYDISKTILIGAGYNYASQFNSTNELNYNTLYARVGYLF